MRRIWVTRDEPRDGGELSAALRAVGLDPILEPVIQRRLTGDIAEALRTLGPKDWLVLTSPYAIAAIPAHLVPCRVAVVGEPSRRAAEARGLTVSRISPDATGAPLWRSLRDDPDGARRILFPRSSRREPPAPWPGIELLAPILYETTPRPFDPTTVARVDAVAVASPSAVAAIAHLPQLPPCASIGPVTTAALRAAGITPRIEAHAPSFTALAGAIAALWSAAGRPRWRSGL